MFFGLLFDLVLLYHPPSVSIEMGINVMPSLSHAWREWEQVGTRSTNWIDLSWAWPQLDVLVWLGPKWFGLDQMHLLRVIPN